MIASEDVQVTDRPERRRAEKAENPLSDALMTRVRLGSAGRIQLKATRVERDTENPSGKLRAHWVAGHCMRNIATPEKVFRMPHMRGAGPVVPQMRRVQLWGGADICWQRRSDLRPSVTLENEADRSEAFADRGTQIYNQLHLIGAAGGL